jgi:hypothetical protein
MGLFTSVTQLVLLYLSVCGTGPKVWGYLQVLWYLGVSGFGPKGIAIHVLLYCGRKAMRSV